MKRGAKLNANGVCPDCGRDYALTDGPSETHCTADDCPSTTRFDFQHITPDGYAVYAAPHELHNEVRIVLPPGYFENFNGPTKWPPAILTPFEVTPARAES